MSTELLETRSGLRITRYVGPEIGMSIQEEPCTSDRYRYQITNGAGMLTTLSRCEWLELADYFLGEHPWQGE
jgi:hypothetical protein